MNLPKRWIEDKSESTALERAILRPALKVAIPSGAEQRIWTRLAAAAPLSAVALTASSAAAGSSAAGAAAQGSAGAVTAIGAGGVKLGLAVVGKAFAIGATSGALVAGGLSAVAPPPSSQEAAPPPAMQAKAAEKTRPERSPTSPRAPGATDRAEPAAPVPAAPAHSPARAAAPEPHRELAPRDGTQAAAPSVNAFPPLAPSPAPAPSSRLREEALVLRRAREALRQGNLSRAFAELEVARTEFPRGALGEEREALTIELLARSGQRDAARLRAQAFVRSFPKSPYLAKVQEFAF